MRRLSSGRQGRLQSTSGKKLSPPLHFAGDAVQSALLPSIFDKALREEKCEYK